MSPRRIPGTWSAALAGALLAAGATSARAQPRMPTQVACVGDSITAGVGAIPPSTNSYPSKLQVLLGAGTIVRNFGHSGATLLTTGDTPYQNQGEYAAANTFVTGAGDGAVVDVIIMLGTNDSKPNNWSPGDAGTRAAQFATDLAALADHFTTMPTHPVVYLALPPDALTNSYTISGSVIRDQIIPIIQQVAADKGLPTIDLNTPTTGQTSIFVDGVHPSNAGYDLVAGVMRDGLMRVPTVSLTSPAADATLPAPVVSLAAEASGGTVAITSVEFFADSSSLGQTAQAPFTLDWMNVPPGAHALTVTATDSTGAAATTDPINITVVTPGPDAGSGGGGSSGCGCRLADRSGASGSLAVAATLAIAMLRSARRRRRR